MRSNDKNRLDWLEQLARMRGGILLHDGSETGRLGVGLQNRRTLRQAIDTAMGVKEENGDQDAASL